MRTLGVYNSWFKRLLPVLCIAAAGCGGSSEPTPELVAVTGTVTFKSEPLAGASISFVPRDGTQGTGAYGVTDDFGKYTLTHRTDASGIEPGTYTVAISKMAMPDGSPIPEGQDAADVGAIQMMPPKYSDPFSETNANIITVPASGGDFPIELK